MFDVVIIGAGMSGLQAVEMPTLELPGLTMNCNLV
jgi:ribulose 1,5-bisphosphate synthetase/thiazole synthase